MKHYLITGGTGLIGSALCRQLTTDGHHVTVLSRRPDTVKSKCGMEVKAVQSLSNIPSDTTIDIVINLAGEPIANTRWSAQRKALLASSRINLTHQLVDWMRVRKQPPACLISGSAVGWYGDGQGRILTEQSYYHDEYTHQLCDAWEKQALRAEHSGIRVCIVRTGLVLSSAGGILQKMSLPFKLGMGGHIGTGEQYMPWIHIADMVRLLMFLAHHEHLNGVFNACSPNPVTNQAFTAALIKQTRHYLTLPVPAWLLRTTLGEMSRLLLTGQRAIPQRATANGFRFSYSTLTHALNHLFFNSQQRHEP